MLQFNTFDSLCMGTYEFMLEEFETDRCERTVFGHSYAATNECDGRAWYHSVRKSNIVAHEENEDYPPCAKVTELLYIGYG